MRSLLLAILVAAVPATAQDPAVADWIASHAIPLKTVEAGHGFDDMQPLKKIIGDARIVALGEATHGTREFFQLKHRMVEFLATQMGFTIFSIEANMPEAYRLNDYVLNGRGDPAELLRGMYFWTWNTNEVLAMIEWMRQFNQSGKGRIEFTGFDMQTPTVAYEIARDFVAKYDPDFTATIKKAPTNAINPPREYTSYTGTFPVADAAGKTIRLSANIKTLNVAGSAAIWWRADHNVDGQSRTSEFKNLGNGTPKGTTDWKHYELEMKVPSDATNINFGLLLEGAGTAWFDEVALSIEGVPYSKASGFDLINTSKPAGSFQLAQGYSGRFETGQHEGAAGPALRITGTAVAPGAVTPNDAAAAWTGILQHMQSAREEYLTKGASAKDADWAIQNARIILQCMQMKSSQNSIAGNGARDRAMAENIQWILDQNPKAKVILWAHNGHVSKKTPYNFKPMGSALSNVFGEQIVVFGFAFNQGSFQAIELGKGRLRNFTVSPMPTGTFDATLAASNLPILALDVKHAPDSGPVADWLAAPHKTRSIGSGFSDDSEVSFREDLHARASFDAVLFVEKTTAAIPNAQPKNSVLLCDQEKGPARCVDSRYKVSVQLPTGWTVQSASRLADHANTVQFVDPKDPDAPGKPSLWYRVLETPQKRTPEEIVASLRQSADGKVTQRVQGGLADYHLRPDSCQARTIATHPAFSCIADATGPDGKPTSEYLTWVLTETTNAFFFGFVPTEELDAHRERFDEIIQTLQIP